MNKIKFTLNAVEVKVPVIQVNVEFEELLLKALREHTSIDIEIYTCQRNHFTEGNLNMVEYRFNNLSLEKLREFEVFSKMLYVSLNNIINHAQN